MARNTLQRQALWQAMQSAGRPLSAQELHEAAQATVPELGIATVYRNLKSLVDDGLLQPVELPGEPTRFELADIGHHHHFMCCHCSRVFDIQHCPRGVENAAPEGFEVERHELVLYGRCADCASH